MPVRTIFISGPRQCGKTTLIKLAAKELFKRPPHVIRLVPEQSDQPYLKLQEDYEAYNIASVHWVTYTPDRVFEVLPQAIKEIRGRQKYITFFLEADADPCLRHAYPFEYRIFVMHAPETTEEVFRSTREAAHALKEVMDDTAAFASEIFGLFEGDPLDDSEGVKHRRIIHAGRTQEELEVSAAQMGRFLSSPLGAEIASRIQLQPEYQALPESDVVLVNTAVRTDFQMLGECIRRIEILLTRIRHDARRNNILCWCDPTDVKDPSLAKLLERLATLWSDLL
jgi:hypothetical protein